MEGNSTIIIHDFLKLIAIILIVGMMSSKISKTLKIPDVVVFLIAGIFIGPAFLDLVNAERYQTAHQLILTFGSAFILYDGGREIKLKVLNNVKISVALLSTVGVVISAFVIGYVSMVIFKIPFIYALLIGSVIASTDPATLVPIFKEISLKEKIKQTIISESAFNDATGAIMVFSVIAIIGSGQFSLMANLEQLSIMAFGGIFAGIVIGVVLSILIADTKFGILHEYAPIMSIVAVTISFMSAELIGGSGYMATFTTGLVCGNKKKFKQWLWMSDDDFMIQTHVRETISFIMRVTIFILLGTTVNFEILGQYWYLSLLVILIFMFVARPLSVISCVIFDGKSKWTKKEILFMMWIRETGVIPAALSGMIVSMNLPHSDIVASVVFMAVLITLCVQATTTKWLAKKLQLLKDETDTKKTI